MKKMKNLKIEKNELDDESKGFLKIFSTEHTPNFQTERTPTLSTKHTLIVLKYNLLQSFELMFKQTNFERLKRDSVLPTKSGVSLCHIDSKVFNKFNQLNYLFLKLKVMLHIIKIAAVISRNFELFNILHF